MVTLTRDCCRLLWAQTRISIINSSQIHTHTHTHTMEKPHHVSYCGGDNLHDYWEAHQKMLEETKMLDDYLEEECSSKSFNEGEEEAEWLKAAGLSELTEPWKAGREILPEELGAAIRPLSRAQAEAVKRRVKSLNHTVKQRFNQKTRPRKPDIRDFFKDVEVSSTGTRSRSATPDSLDSVSGEQSFSTSPAPAAAAAAAAAAVVDTPSFVSIFQKEPVRRLPSAPLAAATPPQLQEIFRSKGNHHIHRADVASNCEGIQLTAFQRLGTIHLVRPRNAATSAKVSSSLKRSPSFNATTTLRDDDDDDENNVTTLNRTSSHGHQSFEQMCRAQETAAAATPINLNNDFGRQKVESLSQRDFTRLQPLLWLELTAVFDKYNVSLVKRKPNKRQTKGGNLFRVSLSTLLLRDSQLTVNEESNIPLIFQKLLCQLTQRGVRKEGILRVAGNKQQVEALCAQLETDFYCKPPQDIDSLFRRTSCHDLAAVLKKLLRDLPAPLLTVEYIDAFHQSLCVKNPTELAHALNLLVLLLPGEHRATLKSLLAFLRLVIEHESLNKMSIHNVAMIVAPSLFPPRYVYPRDCTDLNAQIGMAAICCQVTEALLNNFHQLWDIPSSLITQLRLKKKL